MPATDPDPTTPILLVEDDPVLRDFVADVLVDEGYRVLAAPDGAEALAILAGGARPSLVLLDMHMPVMDGWGFAEAYRRLPAPRAPLVVMTAAHDTRERADAIGADGLLAKPFDLDDLLDAVARFAGVAA